MKEIISENVKKVHNWSNGYGIYVTKEAKILKWNQKTFVKISVVKEDGKEKVVIEKVNV